VRIGIDLRWLQRAYANSPEGALGGVGMVIENLWRGLRSVAPEDTLVGLVNQGPVPFALRTLIGETPHAEIHAIGLHGFVPPLDRRWRFANIAYLVEAGCGMGLALRRLRLDVLHMGSSIMPPRWLGCPTVVTLHEMFAFVREGWLPHRLLVDGIRRSDRVVAVSEAVGQDYAAIANDEKRTQTRVVRNGIDLSIFRPERRERAPSGLPDDYLLHAGVLTPRKNPHGIIAALALLRRHRDIPPLVSVGAYQALPGMRETLVRMAEEAGVEDRLIVLDRGASANDMASLYRGARGLVFPSLKEGFGLPTIESLACGTPCLVSSVGGLPEVTGHLGLLVDPTRPESIADGIARLLDDDDHRARVAAEGPEWAKRFSYQEMARGYVAVYRELAG
jgi:glycosyltransferase involved in cell wall biosynthesis